MTLCKFLTEKFVPETLKKSRFFLCFCKKFNFILGTYIGDILHSIVNVSKE